MSKAIHQGPEKVKEILADFPFLKGKKDGEKVHQFEMMGMDSLFTKLEIETELSQYEIISFTH